MKYETVGKVLIVLVILFVFAGFTVMYSIFNDYAEYRQEKKEVYMKEKPPVGLMPKKLHDEARFQKVCRAISEYYNSGRKIPIKWVEEYNELVEK